MNKGTNQRQMCENCKKIQGDINNATGKQINRRVVIKEDSQIVVTQPKIVYKKPN